MGRGILINKLKQKFLTVNKSKRTQIQFFRHGIFLYFDILILRIAYLIQNEYKFDQVGIDWLRRVNLQINKGEIQCYKKIECEIRQTNFFRKKIFWEKNNQIIQIIKSTQQLTTLQTQLFLLNNSFYQSIINNNLISQNLQLIHYFLSQGT
ncbi:hypothetical protein TTHERM_000049419 (macronuclear) [Tetrahymena thermophila SB210]|uniref:Uncharacterized protein n=1 Tax=Tetrahymena thermophila (strain SB210) TaxID=312017 RepID=W7XK62_TETTS|nr:hypothetical protein TTHERM_000049419 [Tetrahymena thermophila SB210]EWS74624.1 hypothetical protein TTHERM_000049419 [Tetrahymena thermophila SB210]|eukprot:XP_012652846.1 hypothetical protein TTHERM_000049419 [Tetrahymena thermophila SB210]